MVTVIKRAEMTVLTFFIFKELLCFLNSNE